MLSTTKAFDVLPKNTKNSSDAYDHGAFAAFIQRQAARREPKKLAALLTVTTRTVGNMREDGSTSGQTLTKWCRRDPAFRADYFRFCGGHVEASPSLVKNLNEAISAVLAADAVESFHQ
jgi:hypothetical protein